MKYLFSLRPTVA